MNQSLKNSLRAIYRTIRDKLPVAFQEKRSMLICNRIRKMHNYRYAKHIALYHPHKGEVDLSAIWRSAPTQGKFCYFPVLNSDKTLSFLPATPSTAFIKNDYGILEPDVDRRNAIPIENLDIILIPLVVFDKKCTRIGMGGGYYDRSLTQVGKVALIGVAYEFQRADWIKPEAWDIPLSAVVTENTIYHRKEFS